jgi:glycosyltransferase involved in cell wall biosynthesis
MDVSVLMATFRSAATVKAAIESVLAQEGCKVELLIADGGSKDGTVAICESYGDRLAYFKSEPDQGVYDAWNKLLPKAKGEWICFIGSDDELASPQALAQMLRAAQSRPRGTRVVYGRVRYVRADGSTVLEQGRPWDDVKHNMLREMSIPHVGTFHHASMFADQHYFDPAFKIAGDFALLLPECLAHGAYFAQEVLVAKAGWGGISTNTGWVLKCHFEVGVIQRRYSGLQLFPQWCGKLFKILIRYVIFNMGGERGLERYEAFKGALGIRKQEL